MRSVDRVQIELSREYKELEKKPNGYTSWIGHSSFLVNNYDLNIITDPIFSERASPSQFFGPKRLIPPAINYEDLPKIDVIVISHNHYDHLDIKSIKKLCQDRRGTMEYEEFMNDGDVITLRYEIPLSELVIDFFDKLKSIS